jgi:pentatricopeptide repeat protein
MLWRFALNNKFKKLKKLYSLEIEPLQNEQKITNFKENFTLMNNHFKTENYKEVFSIFKSFSSTLESKNMETPDLSVFTDNKTLPEFLDCLEYIGNEKSALMSLHMLNVMIKGYFKIKEEEKALFAYKSIKDKYNWKPNLATFTTMIEGYFSLGNTEEGMKYFELLEQNNLVPDLKIYNFLIKGFSLLKQMDKAEKIFEMFKLLDFDPDLHIYNLMIEGYVYSDKMKDSLKYFELMKQNSITPESSTYIILISGYFNAKDEMNAMLYYNLLIKNNIPMTIDVFNTMIQGFCKLRKMDKALEYVDQMSKENIEPNEETYQILVNGYFSKQNFEKVHEIFQESLTQDKVNINGALNFLFICFQYKKKKLAEDYFELFVNKFQKHRSKLCMSMMKGFHSIKMNSKVIDYFLMLKDANLPVESNFHPILINVCLICHEIQEALVLFKDCNYHSVNPKNYTLCLNRLISSDDVELRDLTDIFYQNFSDQENFSLDTECANKLIKYFASKDNMDQADDVFQRMESPTELSYDLMIENHFRLKFYNKCLDYLCKLEVSDVKIERKTINTMINLFCGSKNYNLAQKYLSILILNKNLPNYSAMRALIRLGMELKCFHDVKLYLSFIDKFKLKPEVKFINECIKYFVEDGNMTYVEHLYSMIRKNNLTETTATFYYIISGFKREQNKGKIEYYAIEAQRVLGPDFEKLQSVFE